MIEHDGPLATEAVSGFIVDIVVDCIVVDCIVVVFWAARIAIDIVAIAGVVRKGYFDLFEEFGCRLCRVEIGFRGADGAFRR